MIEDLNGFWETVNGTQLWRVGTIVFLSLSILILLREAWVLRYAKEWLGMRLRFRNVGGCIIFGALIDATRHGLQNDTPVRPQGIFLTVGALLYLIALVLPRSRKELPEDFFRKDKGGWNQ